jgi:hypothetical protein
MQRTGIDRHRWKRLNRWLVSTYLADCREIMTKLQKKKKTLQLKEISIDVKLVQVPYQKQTLSRLTIFGF